MIPENIFTVLDDERHGDSKSLELRDFFRAVSAYVLFDKWERRIFFELMLQGYSCDDIAAYMYEVRSRSIEYDVVELSLGYAKGVVQNAINSMLKEVYGGADSLDLALELSAAVFILHKVFPGIKLSGGKVTEQVAKLASCGVVFIGHKVDLRNADPEAFLLLSFEMSDGSEKCVTDFLRPTAGVSSVYDLFIDVAILPETQNIALGIITNAMKILSSKGDIIDSDSDLPRDSSFNLLRIQDEHGHWISGKDLLERAGLKSPLSILGLRRTKIDDKAERLLEKIRSFENVEKMMDVLNLRIDFDGNWRICSNSRKFLGRWAEIDGEKVGGVKLLGKLGIKGFRKRYQECFQEFCLMVFGSNIIIESGNIPSNKSELSPNELLEQLRLPASREKILSIGTLLPGGIWLANMNPVALCDAGFTFVVEDDTTKYTAKTILNRFPELPFNRMELKRLFEKVLYPDVQKIVDGGGADQATFKEALTLAMAMPQNMEKLRAISLEIGDILVPNLKIGDYASDNIEFEIKGMPYSPLNLRSVMSNMGLDSSQENILNLFREIFSPLGFVICPYNDLEPAEKRELISRQLKSLANRNVLMSVAREVGQLCEDARVYVSTNIHPFNNKKFSFESLPKLSPAVDWVLTQLGHTTRRKEVFADLYVCAFGADAELVEGGKGVLLDLRHYEGEFRENMKGGTRVYDDGTVDSNNAGVGL